jgi:two-component system CheB/CheR fusion protein
MREDSAAANEELRAANEELQSMNEEYRSTSEELETSKEELQSINEKLTTVNGELKQRLETVSRANSDLQNLMAVTDVGALFLDMDLRIKRFTSQVTDLFSIAMGDEGRPITDFAHKLDYDDLVKDARAVLANLTPIRRYVRSRNDGWYEIRLHAYRTVEDKIDGVVFTIRDVTDRHKMEGMLREGERQSRLVELSREPICMWELDGGIVIWSRGCEELYGYARDEAIGKRRAELLATLVPGSTFDELKAKLAETGIWRGELRQKSKSGQMVTIHGLLELETINTRRLVLETMPREEGRDGRH